MAIELEITTNAHLDGLKKAQAELEALSRAGKSANQNFKWNNLDASMASIRRNFHTNALFPEKGLKSAQKAIDNITNAMKGAEQTIGKGGFVGWLNPDGMSSTITKDLTKVQKHFSSLKDEMVAYYDTYAKATTKQQMVFDPKRFNAGLDKQAEAATMFGKEIDGIALKMQTIKEQGIRMVTKGGDPEQIKALSAQYQELSKQHDKLSAAANGTGTRIKNLIKNFVSAQLVVWAIRQAFTFLTTTIREASQAAAEAEQVSQKFMTVFDGMQKAIDSVDRLTSSFGLAKSSAKDIMSTIGDMASGLGATDAEAAAFAGTTAEFIQDLIAFKDVGGDVIEITKAFMSGAAGNNRNFRQWGSIVKEATVQAKLHEKGLDKLTGSELEWAKAQERVKIVMEQQKNALGATRREWDMFLSVQRRYNEQSKQLKENIGESINQAWLPLKQALLGVVEGWNKAYEAKQNYLKGTDASTPLFNLDTDEGREAAKKSIAQFMSQQQGTITVLGNTMGIDPQNIEAAARAYGITAKEVANLVLYRWESNKTLSDEIRLIDIKLAKEKAEKQSLSDRKMALAEYAQSLTNVIDQLSVVTGTTSYKSKAIMDTMSNQSNATNASSAISDMLSQFKGRKPSDFADALDIALGIGDEDGLKEKQNKIQEAYGILNNALLKAVASGDKGMQIAYENALKALAGMYQTGLADTVGKTLFGDPSDDLSKKMRSSAFEQARILQYGEEMGRIYAQWDDALADADDKKKKALEQGMSETDAEKQRLEYVAKINEYYRGELTDKGKGLALYKEEFKNYALQIESLKYRNQLNSLYGAQNSELVEIYAAQHDEEQKAWQTMKQRVDAGMDANEANAQFLEQMKLITEQYELQLEALRVMAGIDVRNTIADIMEETKWKEITDAVAILYGRKSDDDLVNAYVDYLKKIDESNKKLAESFHLLNNDGVATGRGNIDLNNRPVVTNPDGSRSTVNSTTVGFDDYFAVIPTVINGALGSVDDAIEHYLNSNEHLGIFKIVQKEGETFEQAYERTLNEANAYADLVHDFEQGKLDVADALRDAYELTKEQLIENYKKSVEDARKAMYDQLGDVGMIRDWVDQYKDAVFYAMQDGKTRGEAADIASKQTWEAILMEFATRLEVVNELLSIVSIAFDEFAPIVDDFLRPFLVIVRPIIDSLNQFIPILTLIFPIVKGVAMAFNVVATVLNWFARVVQKVAGELTFWTSSDDVSWSYVNAAWKEGADRNAEIMAMEIEARAEYVSDLTDAQKGEIDAYKELYKQGMLSLTEYSALAGAVTGRTYDKVKVTDIKTQGTTVNYGGITITVNGAEGSPEDIAQAIRAEIEKIERRNIA